MIERMRLAYSFVEGKVLQDEVFIVIVIVVIV